MRLLLYWSIYRDRLNFWWRRRNRDRRRRGSDRSRGSHGRDRNRRRHHLLNFINSVTCLNETKKYILPSEEEKEVHKQE